MTLNHLALNIDCIEEIENFYVDILGFRLEYEFEIPSSLAKKVFDIESDVKVYKVKNGNVFIELFVNSTNAITGFQHICFDVEDLDEIVLKCNEKGYQAKRIVRNDRPDLVFIKDKAGNIFELKEIN
jgi:catechol 2,3-dioxygenase-like lactoylglutathione lyase family enzyme